MCILTPDSEIKTRSDSEVVFQCKSASTDFLSPADFHINESAIDWMSECAYDSSSDTLGPTDRPENRSVQIGQ